MQFFLGFRKFSKLKRLWRQLGTKRLLCYLYQRTVIDIKSQIDFQRWIAQHSITKQDIQLAKTEIESWQLHPKFSVIMPVYNVEVSLLKQAIESVRLQLYQNWELCIADDASPNPEIRSLLENYIQEPRIKVVFRSENGHISAASNSALNLATGDYIALLDHDDELTIDALFENAKLINKHPDADFIYSDEDKIDIQGKRFSPCFKPDWSPEYLHSCMYTCHLSVYRTSIIRDINGFRSEYDGSQDYDLALRVAEKTRSIYHIPKILYHWRNISTSAASGSEAKPWAYTAGKKALEAMLQRSSDSGYVEETINPGVYRVRRHLIFNPLVSIIIFGLDSAGYYTKMIHRLQNCISSIQTLTTYNRYEIIIVSNASIQEQAKLLEILSSAPCQNTSNITLVYSQSKNISKQINTASLQAQGDYLLFLNVNTQVTTPNWLELMLEICQQTEIGAVGTKLVSCGKIKHVGIVMLKGKPYYLFDGIDNAHSGYYCSNIVNRNYLAVTSKCLMIKHSLFQELGRFDETLSDYSDIDLCLRAYQAGYRNVMTPFVQLEYQQEIYKTQQNQEELNQLINKWSKYLDSLNQDPYYNHNFSYKSAYFNLY
ncbi:MAG: glycosyltransferase [Calothrix sp. C42_A2020_038]|nr:glycosyltransferase [Calothrix sp. C42_A2020_038]